MYRTIRNLGSLLVLGICLWLTFRILLPVGLPFFLGGLLAVAAEPAVRLLHRRLQLPRPAAAAVGVLGVFLFIAMLVLLVCAVILRELGILAQMLPDLEQTAENGMGALSGWLLGLVARLPTGVRDILTRNVQEFFSGSSAMLDRAFRYVINMAGGMLKTVPDGALVLGTGIISAFMISARLEKIGKWLRALLENERLRPVIRTVKSMKDALIGYLKAQIKLMGVTWTALTVGFLILRIPYGPLWAALVSLVDMLPVLGTGAVLLPWSLAAFLQQDTGRAVGLLGLYGVVTLTRSLLEPKLLGKQLGLDPLVTLVCLYGGYQLFGLPGMLLSPLAAVAAMQLVRLRADGK